jgi:hypothetical protein
MLFFASAGGVLIAFIHLAGGVLANLSHTVHTFCDTGILPKL